MCKMSDSALLLISKFYRNRSLWCFVEYERSTHCGMHRNQCNKLKTIIYYSLLFRTKMFFFPACTDLIHAHGIFNLFACSESTEAFSCTWTLSCCCCWCWLCSFFGLVWFEASRRQFKSFRLKYSALALELCLFIIPILYCRAFVVCSTNANKNERKREKERELSFRWYHFLWCWLVFISIVF